MNRPLVKLALALALALCAPVTATAQVNPLSAPRGVAKSNSGVVVFFRDKKRSWASKVAFKVFEGEREIGRLSNGSYFTIRARAGKHQYVVHSEVDDVLTIEVNPEETYFIRCAPAFGVVSGRLNLSPSDRKTFAALQADLKESDGK